MTKFPRILIIPMSQQRFTTLGDWYETAPGEFIITAAEMRDWRHVFLVIIHELTEWAICQRHGVLTRECDEFDAMWEEEIVAGKQPLEKEAGFDRRCPYRRGHMWGARMERLFSWLIGTDWKEYCEACDKLIREYDHARAA